MQTGKRNGGEQSHRCGGQGRRHLVQVMAVGKSGRYSTSFAFERAAPQGVAPATPAATPSPSPEGRPPLPARGRLGGEGGGAPVQPTERPRSTPATLPVAET